MGFIVSVRVYCRLLEECLTLKSDEMMAYVIEGKWWTFLSLIFLGNNL